jgi:hypothetical protein
MTDNALARPHIYVASNFGVIQFQRSVKLRQKRPASERSILVVLYVEPVPKSFAAAFQAAPYFDDIEFVQLPRGCHRLSMKFLRQLKRIYTKLLDNLNPETMTLFSFESHYSLLCHLAHERGVYMILSEEGLGSYKYLIKEEKRKPRGGVPLKVAKQKIRRSLFRPLRLARMAFNFLRHNELLYYGQVKQHPIFKVVLRPWKKFDKIVLCYPEILKDYFDYKEIETYEELYLNDKNTAPTKETVERYGINSESVIYISQRVLGGYSRDDFPLVLDILRDLAKEKGWKTILMKLHPKELEEDADFFHNTLAADPLFTVIENYPYPAECLIEYAHPAYVVSIGSVTMVYAYKVSPSTKFISIVSALKDKMDKHDLQSPRSVLFFQEVREIFKLFPHINIYGEQNETPPKALY